ncbi:MAG: 50S ribosomal protein L5 [Holosporales bacterium]|jgi:large subunit ribosomal protein L5|nr:50S ribosomal protein L5 [Holosporales bacterium]
MSYSKDRYFSEIRSLLKKELAVSNEFMIPKLEKIVLNCTSSEAAHDGKALQIIADELTAIAGQKAVITKAKKSIAGFKLRAGVSLGAKVTLRKERMYEFLDRLIYLALPKVRDFRGLSSRSFDGHGNFSMGIKEQIVFPEINYDKIDKVRGFDITVCTTARNDKIALSLLKAFRFPFTS